MFMGTIPIGTTVTVRLQVAAKAKGAAVLAVAWSGGGQTGGHDEGIAAPGGFCTAQVTPAMRGLLRVVVDMNSDTDKGTLAVKPGTTSKPIEGDNSWLYVVR
jgi:hypothetical protein